MYVCLCKAVTCGQIRQAVEEGVSSYQDIKSELGVAQCCGKCNVSAKSIFRDALDKQASLKPASMESDFYAAM